MQVQKQLSDSVGDKHQKKNDKHDDDKHAVAHYAEELDTVLGCEDGPKPRFHVVDMAELPQPDIPEVEPASEV